MKTDKFKVTFSSWENIKMETAKFYFDEAEKRLKETIVTAKNITDSTHKIVTILIPMFLLIFGYIIITLSNVSNAESKINFPLLLTSVSICLILIRALYLSVQILNPRTTMTIGIMPKKLIIPAPINRHGKTDIQLLDILLGACENFQERIDINIDSNKRRTDMQHQIYRLISIFIPLISVIVFIVSSAIIHIS